MNRVNWSGSFPAIMTPFHRDGAINVELLRENVELTISEGASGIVASGHFGEAHLMSSDDRLAVITTVLEVASGAVPIIAGTGGIQSDEVAALTASAAAAGAAGAMIETPYFMTPTEDEIAEHFSFIASRTELPIMLYNNPRRAGAWLTPSMTSQLADIPTVVAIKDSSNDVAHFMKLLDMTSDRLRVFLGPARLFGFAAITCGAAGFVDGLSQVCGRQSFELYDAAFRGDVSRAKEIQMQQFRVGGLLYGAPNTAPATFKDAMNRLGRPGGFARRPLKHLNKADSDALLAALLREGVEPLARSV